MNRFIFALVLFSGLIASVYSNSNPAEEQLVKIRLNEKIAYDLYSEFYDTWKLDVFYNIGESKVVHKMRIKELLKKFNITDPLENNFDRGKFDDSESQSMYSEYLLKGSGSRLSALGACALMEEQIYKDLRECLTDVNDKIAKKILEQMITTTGNHLKAIVKTLNRSGEIYTPKLLTEKELDKILGSEKEIVTSSED